MTATPQDIQAALDAFKMINRGPAESPNENEIMFNGFLLEKEVRIIEQILQSHTPEARTVDVESLKKGNHNVNNPLYRDYNIGWNACIDYLLRRGFRQGGGKGDAINALSICSATGSRWMHVKSTREYVIIGSCRLEHSAGPAYLYRDEAGVVWARDKDEFLDGRFVRIDTPQPEHEGE